MDLTHSTLKAIEQTGLNAIAKAGDIFHRSHSAHIVKHKSHRQDIVTDTDLQMEQAILSTIKQTFPNHGYDSEEAGQINSQADFIWIIDPLDGTKNLTRGIPLIATSLSCQNKGKTVFAAISIHTWDMLIHATEGQGTYYSHQPVHVSATKDLGQAMIYAQLPTPWSKQPPSLQQVTQDLKLFNELTFHCYRVRAFGSGPIGLALTAIGAFDAYVNLYQGNDPGDIEPGKFLVKQAGGKISEIINNHFIASNSYLHLQLLKVLKS